MDQKILERKRREGIWEDQYRKKRERWYIRNEWRISVKEINESDNRRLEIDLIEREKANEWWIVREAGYNGKYKDIMNKDRIPMYLRKEYLTEERNAMVPRALIKTRCGIMEENNKY